jgi:peptidoglycan/LPS O-acetylase OafA/YrhL
VGLATMTASRVGCLTHIIHPKGVGTKLMGISALVLLGNMSYTVYLVHWPVIVPLSPSTTHWSYWQLDVVRIAIVMTLALASWYLIEKPLTKWRRRDLVHSSDAAVAPGRCGSLSGALTIGLDWHQIWFSLSLCGTSTREAVRVGS